jgi:membrane-associated PAP2 superfamily phosphatase
MLERNRIHINPYFNAENQQQHLMLMTILPLSLVLTGIMFEYSGFDIWWISHFYDYQTRSWPFRDHWLFETVIHEWGRYFDMGAAGLWLVFFFLTFFLKPLKTFKKPLIYFLVSSATGPLIVGAGKHLTHIYTPWDLKIFSGTLPYIRLLDPVPGGMPIGEAFPAGHASGGYAFFSLYILMRHLGSPHRIYGLIFALGLGLIFGIGQQVRGAHFPSHDLFTLVICWYSALIFYYIFFPEEWRRCQNGK